MNKKLFMSLIFVFPLFLFAQKSYIISGEIVDDATGKKIEGAHIFLEKSKKGVFSNSDGRFIFKGVAQKTLVLFVSSIGYKTQKVEIATFSGAEIIIRLKEEADKLSEVIVTGTRTRKTLNNTPILTKLISGVELKNAGSLTALDALEYAMPGVQFTPDAHGDNLQIQGLDNDYVLVLLDGERLVGEGRSNVNFDRISAEDIKQIEIVNGASSVLYGSNAIGGVINIITKKNTKPLQATAAIRWAKYNDLLTSVSAGVKKEKLNFRVDAFRRATDGYDLTPKETPMYYTVKPFEDYSGKIKVGYEFSENFRLKTNFSYYRHELKNPPENTISHTHYLNKNYTAGLQSLWKTSAKNTLEMKVHADRYNNYKVFEADNNNTQRKATNTYASAKLIDTYVLSEETNIVAGLEYNVEEIESDLFDANRVLKSKSVNDFNVFVQADHQIIPHLELVSGGRYTRHQNFGNSFTYSFSLLYKLGRFKFRGNIAKGYKAPTLKNMYYDFNHGGSFWIYGNPNLKPEKSIYTALSAEYGKKNFNVSVNLYRNAVDDKIDSYWRIVNGGKELRYLNYERARIKGLESRMKFLLFSFLSGQIGYAYTEAKDAITGLELYGNSRNTYTAGLTWSYHHAKYPFSLSLNGKGSSGMIYDKVNAQNVLEKEKSNVYSIWKATYIQKIKIFDRVNFELSGGVENLFDYQEKEYLITSGRTYFVGLKILFN